MTSRVASLLIGLWLLAVATSASAEGAWVLWQQAMNPPPGVEAWDIWKPFRSYSKEKPCQEDSVRMSQGGLEETRTYKFTFICLPDTVDPRGPKGK